MFTLLMVVIVIALLFDLVNGFHDAANSIATVVSTKVLTPFQAVLWAATFNIIAFWVFDMSVGNTVAKTVNTGAIDLWVILAGLLAATFWNLLTWRLGIPSSSSHTLIGGFAGAAIAHAGFNVINSAEIFKIIAFIFLAPVIGGVIAFVFALITISRNFAWKMISYASLTGGVIYLMQYMVEYMDVKPAMMWIVVIMMGVTGLTYLGYQLFYGKRQTAMRESHMYKRLQLLSSAAFSLGHGGADSQKVMGIICAALMVYGNYARKENIVVDKNLQVSELIQIEHINKKGKIQKFKPEIGTLNNITFYEDGDNLIDIKTQEVIFNDKKLVATYSNAKQFTTYKEANKELEKLHVYSKGKVVYDKKTKKYIIPKADRFFDSETNELIFDDNKLSKNYSKAGVFTNYVNKQEIKQGYHIKGKIHSDTMPFWISFGCYFMIGIGTLMGGWKIVKTMGTKITKVTPLEGVCAETAGALTLFTVSNMGIPVSTTHTITGSIIGVGAIKRLSAVRWGVTINLLWAWILTIPVSGLLAAGFYYLILLFK